MLSRFRHIFGVVFFLLVASCSGGGCGGCGGASGCGGTTPLPGGFPTDKAVENAASVRVSRPGLSFLETNLGPVVAKATNAPGGNLSFGIPESNFTVDNFFSILFVDFDLDATICKGGPDTNANPPKCAAKIGIGASTFKIDAITPSAITLSATIPLELDDTPIAADVNPGPALTLHVGYGSSHQCTGPKQERANVQPKNLPVKVTVPLVAETTAPRVGYTKVDVDNAVIDLSAISGNDVLICADCGPLSFDVPAIGTVNLCNPVLNLAFIKNFLVDQIKNGLDTQVKGILKDALCTAPTPNLNPPCPIGSKPNASNAHCVYDTAPNKCVPMLLGTDAHIDLGSFLASFSPGTSGGLDFGLASFGPMNPAPGSPAAAGRTPNGITLGMIGGALPQPPSKCVPIAPLTLPTGIPVPDEIAPKTADNATAPHVGIALAGRFLDYTFTSVYNSGLLCLGISTEQIDLLKSGLLSFLIPSIKNLTFEQADAAAAIATRPQAPPVLKLGGGTDPNKDPLLLVTLPKFAIDFYIWSFDRFVRAFTFTGDLSIPINLQTGKDPQKNPNGGILPALGDVKIANGKVDNADLLMDDPNVVAGAVAGIFGTVTKQLSGGGLSPIDVSGALKTFGIDLEVNAIKKLTKDSDDFIGIFASFAKTAGTALPEADTQAKLLRRTVNPEFMSASTYREDMLPELEIELASSLDDGTHAIEYSWWIDSGTRSSWSKEKHLVIKDQQLFFQGKHVLRVVARIEGETKTEDATPAEIPFVIDTLAPLAKLEPNGDAVTLKAWDVVSAPDTLVARYHLGNADGTSWTEWTDFRPLADVTSIALKGNDAVEVEVKDEEGNVGRVTQGLIRGRSDSTLSAAGGGCGCKTAGGGSSDDRAVLALVLALGALGFVVARRNRRAVGGGGGGGGLTGAAVALGTIGAVAATSQGCACGDSDDLSTNCGSDCNQECLTGLGIGQPGAYLSVAKAKDGAIWAAGYNDSLLSEGDALLWGDLVVGKYDLGKGAVQWETVDGIATRTDGTCGDYEPNGWRKGETTAGDNVGRWTSIQVSNGGKPMVTYYDDTNKRLKLAVLDDGWKVTVLKEQAGADIGKYSKIILVDGKPVIAFLHIEPGNAGRTRSKIVVGRAKVEEPREASDFDFEDAAVDEDGPCRADACDSGQQCIKSTGTCTKTVNGCAPACGVGQACVSVDGKATCQGVAGTVGTYPRAVGAYINIAQGPKGLGMIAYDGFHGNLVAYVDKNGGRWDRFILDGETGSRKDDNAIDTGDVGIAASLTIAPSGTWHVSYVNGLDESLRYITFDNDKVGRSQMVDDGSTVDGKAFTDGKHVVGDDSAINVEGDTVTIYYSDSSSLGMRKAVGTTSGGTRKWNLTTVKQPDGRWVAFPAWLPTTGQVFAWWRQTTRATRTVEGNVTLISD